MLLKAFKKEWEEENTYYSYPLSYIGIMLHINSFKHKCFFVSSCDIYIYM